MVFEGGDGDDAAVVFEGGDAVAEGFDCGFWAGGEDGGADGLEGGVSGFGEVGKIVGDGLIVRRFDGAFWGGGSGGFFHGIDTRHGSLKTPAGRPSCVGVNRGYRRLGEFAAEAAGVFEKGEEVRHAEEGAGGLVEVDEFKFAAAGAAGDVESGEGAEAGRVHVLDLLHVDDDALFGGEKIADFVAELGGVVGDEFAVAFDDGGAVDAVGVEVEVLGGLGRWVGHGRTPCGRNAARL
jgi:hypothetical protein